MCYSYRDRGAIEEARKVVREREDRLRREKRAKEATTGAAPEKERQLVKA